MQNQEDREKDQVKPIRNPPRRVDPSEEEPFDVSGSMSGRGRFGKKTSGHDRDGSGGSKQFIIMAVISVAVFIAMSMVNVVGIKQADLNKTFDSIAKDIITSKDADKSMLASVTTLTNQIAGMTSTNAANAQAIAAQNSKIDSALSQANSANSQIGSLNTQLATASANIGKVQSDLAALQKTPSVSPDLQKQIDADKAAIVAMQKQIDDINKKLATVPTAFGGGTNSTGLVTHTFQGVTATLTNMYTGFSGLPLLQLNVPIAQGGVANSVIITNGGTGYSITNQQNNTTLASIQGVGGSGATAWIPVVPVTSGTSSLVVGGPYSVQSSSAGSGYTNNGPVTLVGGIGPTYATGTVSATTLSSQSTSQTITLQVTNTNTVVVNNVQLALGLAVVDSSGNSVSTPLPTGQTLAVSSGGFGSSWTFQNITSPNIWIFTNVASSNMFGLGAISLQPGQTLTLTQNIQLNNTTTSQQGGTVYLYPIIRVLSFTG